MTPLPNRFPILRAAAIGALALLVAMMALVHPASAEGVAASCATGGAVPDEASTGLVSDCDALLVARDTLAGSATLNWSVDSSIADWEGVILAGSPAEVAMGQGESVAQVSRRIGVSTNTFYRWRQEYGGTQDRPGEAVTGDEVGEYPLEACGGGDEGVRAVGEALGGAVPRGSAQGRSSLCR